MGDYLYGPVPTLDEVVSKLRDLEVQINSEALTDTKS
jgi:hypothetical protein